MLHGMASRCLKFAVVSQASSFILCHLREMQQRVDSEDLFCLPRYVFPCYNYTVSGLSTPVFMSIPIVYIWAGAFPALLTVKSCMSSKWCCSDAVCSSEAPLLLLAEPGEASYCATKNKECHMCCRKLSSALRSRTSWSPCWCRCDSRRCSILITCHRSTILLLLCCCLLTIMAA